MKTAEEKKRRLIRLRSFLNGKLARNECLFSEHKNIPRAERDEVYNRVFCGFLSSIIKDRVTLKHINKALL